MALPADRAAAATQPSQQVVSGKADIPSADIIQALRQYRDDLRWPPERDSIDRRFAMIDGLISKLGAIQ